MGAALLFLKSMFNPSFRFTMIGLCAVPPFILIWFFSVDPYTLYTLDVSLHSNLFFPMSKDTCCALTCISFQKNTAVNAAINKNMRKNLCFVDIDLLIELHAFIDNLPYVFSFTSIFQWHTLKTKNIKFNFIFIGVGYKNRCFHTSFDKIEKNSIFMICYSILILQ